MSNYEIPTDFHEKYSDDDKTKIIEIYNWLNAKKGRTKSKLTRRSGMAAGTVASVLSGSFGASPSVQLTDLLASTQQASYSETRSQLKIVETTVYKIGMAMFTRSQRRNDFTLFCGNSGIGKTVVATEFAADRTDVIYISALDDMKKRTLLEQLVIKTGATPRRWGTDAMLMALIEKLKNQDMTILLDEAENADDGCFESLRQLHDHASVGFCLIGEPVLFTRIKGKDQFNKLENRLKTNSGVIRGISRNDSDLIVSGYFGDVDSETAQAFWNRTKGSARRLGDGLINEIIESNYLDKHTLDKKLVNAVSKDLLRD